MSSKERKLILAEIEEQLSDCKFKLMASDLDKKDLTKMMGLVKFYCAAYRDFLSYDRPIKDYDSAAEILGKVDRLVRFEKNYFRWLLLLWQNEYFKMFVPVTLILVLMMLI